MKIESGRIQQAGLNPNNGRSLGFVGMGQTDNIPTPDGLPMSDVTSFNPLPSSVDIASDSTYGATGTMPTAAQQQAALIAQYGTAGAGTLSSTPVTSPGVAQPFQWGTLLIGLGALFCVVVLEKGNK